MLGMPPMISLPRSLSGWLADRHNNFLQTNPTVTSANILLSRQYAELLMIINYRWCVQFVNASVILF